MATPIDKRKKIEGCSCIPLSVCPASYRKPGVFCFGLKPQVGAGVQKNGGLAAASDFWSVLFDSRIEHRESKGISPSSTHFIRAQRRNKDSVLRAGERLRATVPAAMLSKVKHRIMSAIAGRMKDDAPNTSRHRTSPKAESHTDWYGVRQRRTERLTLHAVPSSARPNAGYCT